MEPPKAQAPLGVGGPPNLMMMGGGSPITLKKAGVSTPSTPDKKPENGSASSPASPTSSTKVTSSSVHLCFRPLEVIDLLAGNAQKRQEEQGRGEAAERGGEAAQGRGEETR